MGNKATTSREELEELASELPSVPKTKVGCARWEKGTNLEEFRESLRQTGVPGCFYDTSTQKWYHLPPPLFAAIPLDETLLRRMGRRRAREEAPEEPARTTRMKAAAAAPGSTAMSMEDFCNEMLTFRDSRRTFNLRLSDSLELPILVKKKKEELQFTLDGRRAECFKLVVEPMASATLDYLLYGVNKGDCPDVPNFGTVLLGLVDEINDCLEVKYCELTNASYFVQDGKELSADCLYSRTHHGLTFYMNRGFLVASPRMSVKQAIRETNAAIRRWNLFWNYPGGQASMRRYWKETPCTERQKNISMVKFYKLDIPIRLHIPANPLAPAFFYLENEKGLQEKITNNEDVTAELNYLRALADTGPRVEQLIDALLDTFPAENRKWGREFVLEDLATQSPIQNAERKRNTQGSMFDAGLKEGRTAWFRLEDVAHVVADLPTEDTLSYIAIPSGTSACRFKQHDAWEFYLKHVRRAAGAARDSDTRSSSFVLYWAVNGPATDFSLLGNEEQELDFLTRYYAQLTPWLRICHQANQTDTNQPATLYFDSDAWYQAIAKMRFVCLSGVGKLIDSAIEMNRECQRIQYRDEWITAGNWQSLISNVGRMKPIERLVFEYAFPPILDEKGEIELRVSPPMALIPDLAIEWARDDANTSAAVVARVTVRFL